MASLPREWDEIAKQITSKANESKIVSFRGMAGFPNTEVARKASHAAETNDLRFVRLACDLFCDLVPFPGQGCHTDLLQSDSPRMGHLYLDCGQRRASRRMVAAHWVHGPSCLRRTLSRSRFQPWVARHCPNGNAGLVFL